MTELDGDWVDRAYAVHTFWSWRGVDIAARVVDVYGLPCPTKEIAAASLRRWVDAGSGRHATLVYRLATFVEGEGPRWIGEWIDVW